VELQWCRLWEMEIGKGRRWGRIVFEREEGEEARQIHNAGGIQHSEERRGGRGGRRRRLEVKDDQMKLGRWIECAVGSNYELGQ
jgi:hypothetical protein